MNHTDKINQDDPGQHDQNMVFTAMKYVEENYKDSHAGRALRAAEGTGLLFKQADQPDDRKDFQEFTADKKAEPVSLSAHHNNTSRGGNYSVCGL